MKFASYFHILLKSSLALINPHKNFFFNLYALQSTFHPFLQLSPDLWTRLALRRSTTRHFFLVFCSIPPSFSHS